VNWQKNYSKGLILVLQIKTIFPGNKVKEHVGCGECQTSCQSACKTSCTVANQNCEADTLNPLRKNPLNSRIKKTLHANAV
jgi:predicted ribosomally synthesized six-cysteine peptide SCIFF